MQTLNVTTTKKIRYFVNEDTNIKWYCIRDVIDILDYNGGGHKLYCNYTNFINMKEFELSTMQGPRNSNFVDYKSLLFLLTKTRKPKVADILKALECDHIVMNQTSKEELYTERLLKLFPTLKFKKQYKVAKYRLDLYSKSTNIIIEIDEHGHHHYDTEKEKERTETVNKTLENPNWIRFNPDDPNFSFDDVIGSITTLLFPL